jgi:hypothetical protein
MWRDSEPCEEATMRRRAIAMAALAALAFAAPGWADDEEEEEELSPWQESTWQMQNRLKMGLNGVLTWPADPVMSAVDPPKALEEAGFARYPLGFGSGVLLMLYRLSMGLVDVALFVFNDFAEVSPPPRYRLIPGFEHPDE